MYWQKTANGKYQYFERYKDRLTGRTKTASIVLKGNRQTDQNVARRLLFERIQALSAPADISSSVTLSTILRYWNERHSHQVKPQTAVVFNMRMSDVISCIGGDVIVEKLTANIVKDRLASKKVSHYNTRIQAFKQIIRWAYREELISSASIADKLTLLKDESKIRKVSDKYLEHDEINRILSNVENRQDRLLIEFLILSGLRIGEAIALERSDVGEYIAVTKTFDNLRKEVSYTAKTEKGNRNVFVQDELKDCIRRIDEYHGNRKYLFERPDGTMISYATFYQRFGDDTERLIGIRLSPHALRHTHVSLLAEAGISLEAIARRVGHANSQTTKDIYMHITERMTERDNRAIQKLILL